MKIRWTEPALSDLKSIRDYIKRDSEFYATRFVEKIIEVVESLETFPKRNNPPIIQTNSFRCVDRWQFEC